MQFNTNADQQDLISEITRICGASTTDYPLKDRARRVNMGLDRFIYLALTSDGTWQFDDSNNTTDLPIGTTNLISGQQDYAFASDVLVVDKVLAKDPTGIWTDLELTDLKEIAGKNIFGTTIAGTPTKYDVFANSVFLDNVPNYNSTSGLKVVFQRGPSYFASTDTTKIPGIPAIFHGFLARFASLPFLIEKGKAHKSDIASQIQLDEIAIKNFYGQRNKGKVKRMRASNESNK